MKNRESMDGRRIGKPVKMLTVFTPEEIPRPWKFKWTDGKGYEETVIVDKIESSFTAAGYIQYNCISYYENIAKRYELIFWHDGYRWELYTT